MRERPRRKRAERFAPPKSLAQLFAAAVGAVGTAGALVRLAELGPVRAAAYRTKLENPSCPEAAARYARVVAEYEAAQKAGEQSWGLVSDGLGVKR